MNFIFITNCFLLLLVTYSSYKKTDEDFEGPDGNVLDDAIGFGKSWKVAPAAGEEVCIDVDEEEKNPCIEHPEREAWASLTCQMIYHPAFKSCHDLVSFPILPLMYNRM